MHRARQCFATTLSNLKLSSAHPSLDKRRWWQCYFSCFQLNEMWRHCAVQFSVSSTHHVNYLKIYFCWSQYSCQIYCSVLHTANINIWKGTITKSETGLLDCFPASILKMWKGDAMHQLRSGVNLWYNCPVSHYMTALWPSSLMAQWLISQYFAQM